MFKPHKTSSLGLALLAATCLTPPTAALAEPGDPLGGEFRVNSYVIGSQGYPSVASDAEGNFVVAWASLDQDGDGHGVFAQRYDASGTPQGAEFQVNTTTAGAQWIPKVAMNADGDFVVVWEDRSGNDGSDFGIFAQRFNATGDPQGDEFQVNTYTTDSQWNHDAAMDADGNFVVVWQSNFQDGNGGGIFAQRYDSAGARRGEEFQVNTYNAHQSLPSVAMDAGGNFVAAWTDWDQDGSLGGIFARRYDAAGDAQGVEFQANPTSAGSQAYPDVAMDADGDFVVAWEGAGVSSIDIFAQRYNANGERQGPEVRVNSTTAGSQYIPAVEMDADGDFVVVWEDRGGADGSYLGVFAQRFDAAGGTQGTEFQVNSFTANSQGLPALAMDADGDFVVTWNGAGTGDGDGVFARRFQGDGPVAGDFTVDGRADILWRNTDTGVTAIWKMDGFAMDGSASIGAPPLEWQVQGLADFDGDARADILWRHGTSGNTVIWKMNGLAMDGSASIGTPPLVWDLEGAGDSDGDRKADILWWRNSSTEYSVVWKMDGFVREAEGGIGNVPLVWEVQ